MTIQTINSRMGQGGFRELQIIPSADDDEFLSDGEIPVNKVGEPYPDAYTYLETQFRLLREDLLGPYREGIRSLRNLRGQPQHRKLQYELQLYSSVRYVGTRAGRDGVDHGVSFTVEGEGGGGGAEEDRQEVDWEKSKLLMPNSLLCISGDGFATFSWAVVSNRNLENLYNNRIIGLRPIHGSDLNLENGTDYRMFESTRAYYEAYIHVLKVLQRPEMENISFHRNLVALESDVSRPDYANLPSGDAMDWHRICERTVDSLDESQEMAIAHGLTKRLAIIQGPPGTGKTFVGLLIVKALLKVKKERSLSGPILVVCYTNRALDQFLEGIYEFENSLVRLGSRSKSRILGYCSLEWELKRRRRSVPGKLRRQLYRAIREKESRARTVDSSVGIIPREELSALCDSYARICRRVSEIRRAIQTHVLRKVKVLGMTTTVAARNHDLLVSLGSEIMVVEEAAEVSESHTLGCLNPTLKHLILIGDHMQLRPFVASPGLANAHGLDVSMFERMVAGGVEHRTLRVQRRMRPAISSLLVSAFYPTLTDHSSVCRLPDVGGVKANVFFVDHRGGEDKSGSGSRMNAEEADMVVQFCLYLTHSCNYSPGDIAILAMYRSQTEEIAKRIENSYRSRSVNFPGGSIPRQCRRKSMRVGHGSNKNQSSNYNNNVNRLDAGCIPRVRSVDEFQGEESNIVLLSLVRNANTSDNNYNVNNNSGIGFLSVSNRICVALSRARMGLYIFGNAELVSNKSAVWSGILRQLTENFCVGDGLPLCCPRHPDVQVVARAPRDLRNLREAPQNFCVRRCRERLTCGHRCPRRCHVGDHRNFACRERCMRRFEWCGHLCSKMCHGSISSSDVECFPCKECNTSGRLTDNLRRLLAL